LNDATHDNLDKFVGGVSIPSLQQLMYTATHGWAVDNAFNSLLTEENIERFKNIPIFFIHGENNAVYTPESTKMSYDLLREKFGEAQYERWVFENKGHLDCWMGKGSYLDVYPKVEEHAKKTIISQRLVPTV
jgi:hypothetical protein